MKFADMHTTCACGSKIEFKMKKPTHFEHRVAKVTCPGCKSRFMIEGVLKVSDGIRSISFASHEIEITPKLTEIVQAKKAPPS